MQLFEKMYDIMSLYMDFDSQSDRYIANEEFY